MPPPLQKHGSSSHIDRTMSPGASAISPQPPGTPQHVRHAAPAQFAGGTPHREMVRQPAPTTQQQPQQPPPVQAKVQQPPAPQPQASSHNPFLNDMVPASQPQQQPQPRYDHFKK